MTIHRYISGENDPLLLLGKNDNDNVLLGHNSSDLTIVILSMNKISLLIRLLKSLVIHVPEFAGEILIADNNSDPSQLSQLTDDFLPDFPILHRVLRFEQNYGVAGGRNRALKEVRTTWVMSLDNDIYFISNPFSQLQQDLLITGAHFLSVPLVAPDLKHWYSYGGPISVVVEHGKPRLGIGFAIPPGSALEKAKAEGYTTDPFFGSFIYGGASLLKRDSFWKIGGFDDNMFVGFEDLDFSLRVYRAGMKVACSTVVSFVHDHTIGDSEPDKDYERIRYSQHILHTSALYLENKTGFTVWGKAEDEWLVSSRSRQSLTPIDSNFLIDTNIVISFKAKPRIALIIDAEGWAFHNIALQIKYYCSNIFDIYILTLNDISNAHTFRLDFLSSGPNANMYDALGRLLLISDQYNIVHFFQKEFLIRMNSPRFQAYAQRFGLSPQELVRRARSTTLFTTAVYDHGHSSNEALNVRLKLFQYFIDGYTVSSEKLHKIYASHPTMTTHLMTIPDGVDFAKFFPMRLTRFAELPGRELVVGWAGNSKWGDSTFDHKGYWSILKPAIEQLQQQGHRVRLEVQDRNERHIALEEMVYFYAKLDVYVCVSDAEGTPNPVLEAMACGVPVISTDVGIVPEVLGPLQREFILPERSIAALQRSLIALLHDPSRISQLSGENLHSIVPWSWKTQTQKFRAFFSQVLAERAARGEVR